MLWNSFKINVHRAVSIELWTVVFFNSNMRQRVNIIRICNFRFRFQLRDTFDRFTNTMENGRVSKANTKPGSTPLCFITDRNIERINSRILESSRCITFRKHSSHYQHTHFAPASRHTHSEHVRRILAERARWWWLQTISLEQLARNKEPPSSPPPVTALGSRPMMTTYTTPATIPEPRSRSRSIVCRQPTLFPLQRAGRFHCLSVLLAGRRLLLAGHDGGSRPVSDRPFFPWKPFRLLRQWPLLSSQPRRRTSALKTHNLIVTIARTMSTHKFDSMRKNVCVYKILCCWFYFLTRTNGCDAFSVRRMKVFFS